MTTVSTKCMEKTEKMNPTPWVGTPEALQMCVCMGISQQGVERTIMNKGCGENKHGAWNQTLSCRHRPHCYPRCPADLCVRKGETHTQRQRQKNPQRQTERQKGSYNRERGLHPTLSIWDRTDGIKTRSGMPEAVLREGQCPGGLG